MMLCHHVIEDVRSQWTTRPHVQTKHSGQENVFHMFGTTAGKERQPSHGTVTTGQKCAVPAHFHRHKWRQTHFRQEKCESLPSQTMDMEHSCRRQTNSHAWREIDQKRTTNGRLGRSHSQKFQAKNVVTKLQSFFLISFLFFWEARRWPTGSSWKLTEDWTSRLGGVLQYSSGWCRD